MEAAVSEMPKMSSRVRVHNAKSGKSELLGFAELVVGGAFVIKDIRIVRTLGPGGKVFISFPERRGKGASSEEWFGVAHPITAQAYKRAAGVILEAYEKETVKT